VKTNDSVFAYVKRLQRVREYVEGHLTEPLPVKKVAAVAGLETKYFSTFFRRHTGVCYRDWLAWMRVQRAAELIEASNHKLTRLAFIVGFRSVRTFERAFKRHNGMTPQEYKSSVRPRPAMVKTTHDVGYEIPDAGLRLTDAPKPTSDT
jgi:two-component system response regulator YesN